MKLGFVLKEISYLKAFMPLANMWKGRHEIYFFICSIDEKLTSPVRNKSQLAILKEYPWIWFNNSNDIFNECRDKGIKNLITLEGQPFADENRGDADCNIFVITHATDAYAMLERYYDKVNWILFNSNYMAKNYREKDTEKKFLITGGSQYLMIKDFNKQDILNKYKIPASKKIICVLGPPKKFYKETSKIIKILCDYAQERDYYIVYKTKKKQAVNARIYWYLRKFRYFYDVSYFPFTTLELIYISDLSINFDSTAIQEMITLGKKSINFFTKSFRRMVEIYEEEAIPDLPLSATKDEVCKTVDGMLEADLEADISLLRDRYCMSIDQISHNFQELEKKFIE